MVLILYILGLQKTAVMNCGLNVCSLTGCLYHLLKNHKVLIILVITMTKIGFIDRKM